MPNTNYLAKIKPKTRNTNEPYAAYSLCLFSGSIRCNHDALIQTNPKKNIGNDTKPVK